ncbi:MAG: acyl-CoA thioesterase [Planctomycetes bacterium]|nr:acyl-CoA thioesterase [Planctomycetota bacterium]
MGEFVTTQKVRFGHVDPAGIAYFPRIYDYIHEAFEELWDVHVGARYYELIGQRRIGFPLVHSEVDFESPLRFGDCPRVVVTCFHLGRSSLGLRYRYSLGARLCLDARMTTACIDLVSMKSLAMPAEYRAKFEEIMAPLEAPKDAGRSKA